MHFSSLPGDYGCGSFGRDARKFVDFLADSGFTLWQVLPCGAVDSYGSPYSSKSSFSGNPFFVDLEILNEKGLITDEELTLARQSSPYLCEFDRLRSERVKLLAKAASRVSKPDRKAIKEYIASRPYVLKFAKFMALLEANGGKPWSEWNIKEADEERLFVWEFIEYEFLTQLEALKKYANSMGVSIIGDMPMYVCYDSADVYFETKNFMLDDKKMPTAVAGVPPDAFSDEGQLWGNPLYDWDYMKKHGYKFWLDRFGFALEIFDGVRIDHFLALDAYYEIPLGKTAKEGKWVKSGGKELIDKMVALSKGKTVIAEDLGTVTDSVKELIRQSGFACTRVIQFGFPKDDDNEHKPHNFPASCAAYTGTHDNNTLLGYLFELDETARRELFDYCGHVGNDIDEGCNAVIRTLFASSAGYAIFPIQDLLGYGRDTRMNRPGVAYGNWGYRVTREQLNSIDRKKYKHLNKIFCR